MLSGPVVAIVVEGLDAVKTGRAMLGATNPLASAPGKCLLVFALLTNITKTVSGTIRGDYALAVGRNICHGSDSVESALKEIALYVSSGSLCLCLCAHKVVHFQLVPQWYRVVCSFPWASVTDLLTPCCRYEDIEHDWVHET